MFKKLTAALAILMIAFACFGLGCDTQYDDDFGEPGQQQSEDYGQPPQQGPGGFN